MKKLTYAVLLLVVGMSNAQVAYKGKGDIKAQVGANIQSGATGIFASADFGLGENMSVGLSSNYLLSVQGDYFELNTSNPSNPYYEVVSPKFTDRIDLKARFNANIGSVIGLDEKMDVYPGLDLGLRNFGTHLGFRYFFTEGFGVFGEAGIPLAKYSNNNKGFDYYNNQFGFNIGASFNL